MAVSSDKRYVVTVNSGYGTFESGYRQSLSVMDTQTGKVEDFQEPRTAITSKEDLYLGVAFSADSKHVYATMGSTHATGELAEAENTMATEAIAENGILVYGFADGKITPERLIPVGLQKLAPGKTTNLIASKPGSLAEPYPAGIAVVPGGRLLVADNLSDDALLINVADGKVIHRFDLSESDAVPATYPVAVAVSKDGRRAWVALWNASELVELDLASGRVGKKLPLLKPSDPVKPGSHPCALTLSPDGRTLYVALANRDSVAAVDTAATTLRGYFDTRLPRQSYFGAEPDAVAVSADGRWLYAANMGSDAVAVIDTRKLTRGAAKAGMAEPDGFIPTEWMPVSLAVSGGKLFVATAKGRSTGANAAVQRMTPEGRKRFGGERRFTYIGTLVYGSLAAVDLSAVDLKAATEEVMQSNRMRAAEEKLAFASGADPIKHVIYIIKENRTYDQILGDLEQGGKPVGNGDPKMTMYGESITPNEHKLALQFGVLDNFFDSAEVSGDGHVWSNAAIGTDYLEKSWPQNYRNSQRTYDYEGVVANGFPLQQKIADVVEPSSGYMWGNAETHGKTHYNFGEYIASTFCNEKWSSAEQGPMLAGGTCSHANIKPGEAIPADWGGGVNKWPWAIPLLQKNVPTKPELVGHYAEESPDFNLRVPDQIRAEVFLRHLAGWVKDRSAGNDSMPNYITVRLGNDHTAGTTPGGPMPKASVADNDLALGRLVEGISHSPYWGDTAIFVLEDDAQNGGDHVDAHRSTVFAISKYAPHGHDGSAFVDSRFYSTVSVVRTMEMLLGLPPMNNNDALSSAMSAEFAGPGDQKPYVADTSNRDNGLIYTANGKTAPGAAESAKMDFTHEDRADARKLNAILWKDAMGDRPLPEQIRHKSKEKAKDDDD
jgi:DNA-binding beta-propeller fold protein YncE